MTNSNTMRDPAGNLEQYDEFFRTAAFLAQARQDGFDNETLEQQVHLKFRDIRAFQNHILHVYGRGDPLRTIKDEILAGLPVLRRDLDFLRTRGAEFNPHLTRVTVVDGTTRINYAFAAFVLILVTDDDALQSFRNMIEPAEQDTTSYLFHLLVKSFFPEFELAKKYSTDKYRALWTDPILQVLAQPGEKRPAAMAAHMKNWPRLMRPHGWKPNLDTRPGKDNLFCDFAFEVALAVCAYDIDDRSFAAHPYYPRDLVEYYRKHVRGIRDVWRPESAGAGVPIIAPPLPRKADLAKSRRKNFARWVELACDGDVHVTEAVLEDVGKLRKVRELDALLEALAGHVIHADIKDDETVEMQASELAVARGQQDFEGPDGPPLGPARCVAILRSFTQWLQSRGYRLVDLDNHDDAWHAAVVKADYHQEFLTLSTQLGIVTRDPADVYDE